LRRLAAGEDPEVIEAERRAAEIDQKATEDKIKIQEDLLDKELQQQRTIADFQKNTAKQIADANEDYAKRVGEIQRDFAKASAKIIEEGSGAAARRITLAAQIVSQVLQRTALNQQRAQYGLQPIGEPTGFRGGQPVYGQMTGEEVPSQIKRIDINLEQLLKKLQESPRGQASLLGRRVSSLGIGEQFLGMLGAESGYEDVAGLLPLPIQRMQQQAARPLRMIWQKIQSAMEGVYGATEKQIKETFKPDPLRNSKVLQRIQQAQEAILNWDPLEAQWKETQNQLRQTKRSKPASMPLSSFVATAQQMRDSASEVARKAGGLAAPAGARLGSQLDLSDYLSEQQKRILVTGIKEVLSSPMNASFQELRGSAQKQRDPSLMPSFERATSQMQGLLPSFRAVIQEALSQEAVKGQRYAMDAMKKLGMPAPVDPGFYRSPLYEDPSRAQERLRQLSPLNEPPLIIPGIESKFEGAMLPGRGFNISKLTRNLGNVATAGSLAGLIPAAGATTQLRQQGAQQQIQQVDQSQLQQQFELFSNITGASRDTYRNLQDQSREIDLQVKYLSQGHEPALARELASLQQSHETQKRRLELQAQALINNGANEELVTSQLDIELQNLDVLNKQNQALAVQNEKRNKAIQDAIQLRDAVLNPLQQGFGQAFDLLIQGTENWGDSLRNIAATVLQDIARQLIQIYVINQAISAISKLFPAPSGTIPVAAVAANGLAFAKNGIQPFAMGGIVNKPTLFKYADGGTGRFGLMGEAGPEAIIPLKRGRDGRLGVSGGGGVNVGEINITVQNTGENLTPAAQKQLASQVRGIVLATLVNEQRSGGVLR